MIKVFHRLIARAKWARLLLYFCVVIVVIVASYFYSYTHIQQKKFDSKIFLEELRATTINQDEFFTRIRKQLREIVISVGPPGAVELTKSAFVHGDITFVHCHTLMHLTGHLTVALKLHDTTSGNVYDSNLCGFGYSHGLEAQTVDENLDDIYARMLLHKLCAALQTTSPETTCYEGAGHAFMERTLTIEKAIDLCDGLTSDGPVRDPFMCYKGVFAEYTNLVGGNDTETGQPYSEGPILTLPASTPIAYCVTLPDKYSLMCANEVCGLHAADMTRALTEVIAEDYPIDMQAACVRNAAGAKGEDELSHAETVAIPSIVFSLPKELRRQYISGTIGEFNSYAKSGAQKDWQSFCNAFIEEHDRSFCAELVQRK